MTMKEHFATINNIRLCFEECGDGDPVILVHGITAKKEDWIGQFIPLSKKFRVIRIDNRGAGKSDRPNIPYTMKMLADDIKGLMNYLLEV